MPGTRWNVGLLTAVGLVMAAIAASASAPATAVGPCLPAGIKLPPGTPPLPPCPKPGAGKTGFELSVDGSITAAFTGHAGPWGHCTPAQGGGSHTDASSELNFGQPTAEPATASFRTAAQKRHISHFDAQPQVHMTVTPHQLQRHEVPPGCGAVTDPTTCSVSKFSGELNVHVSAVSDLARVTVQPSASPSLAHCAAPFTTGDDLFDQLSFQHELDDIDGAKLVHVSDPKSTIRKIQIEWSNPEKPCATYGGPAAAGSTAVGSIDTCTIKADFRIVIMRVSRPAH